MRDVTPMSTGAELRFATSGAPGDNKSDERAGVAHPRGPKTDRNSGLGSL